jgi:YggT family protein
MNYAVNAVSLIIGFVFSTVVGVLVLRMLAEVCRADFHNPLCQFLYRYTNPVLQPLRKVIPTWRRWNIAAILLAYIAECIKLVLMFALIGMAPDALGLPILALAELLDFIVMLYVVLIFAWSIMSMLNTDRAHPVLRLVGSLTEPVLRPLRGRMLLGGLDFSPAVVLLILMILRVTVIAMLTDLGTRLMMAG